MFGCLISNILPKWGRISVSSCCLLSHCTKFHDCISLFLWLIFVRTSSLAFSFILWNMLFLYLNNKGVNFLPFLAAPHHQPAVETSGGAGDHEENDQIKPKAKKSERQADAGELGRRPPCLPLISLTESFLHKLEWFTLSVRKCFCSTGGASPWSGTTQLTEVNPQQTQQKKKKHLKVWWGIFLCRTNSSLLLMWMYYKWENILVSISYCDQQRFLMLKRGNKHVFLAA